mmetsp:Transcript_125649/g.363552  ORF Transcript_125649/g.363552 Transcript_125649/m.363552 type:complete len:257 (-) Transcript_125649:1793-2563(-)
MVVGRRWRRTRPGGLLRRLPGCIGRGKQREARPRHGARRRGAWCGRRCLVEDHFRERRRRLRLLAESRQPLPLAEQFALRVCVRAAQGAVAAGRGERGLAPCSSACDKAGEDAGIGVQQHAVGLLHRRGAPRRAVRVVVAASALVDAKSSCVGISAAVATQGAAGEHDPQRRAPRRPRSRTCFFEGFCDLPACHRPLRLVGVDVAVVHRGSSGRRGDCSHPPYFRAEVGECAADPRRSPGTHPRLVRGYAGRRPAG